jgi:hypothetical protein
MKKHTPKLVNQKSNTKTRTATSPASKTKNSVDKQKQNRLNQQMVDDLVNFVGDLPAFSFVLLAKDGTCATRPSLTSAVDLVTCALQDMAYEGPYPTSHFKAEAAKAATRTTEIVEAVKKRIRQFRRAGASVILCWQAFGEERPRPHLDCTGDYADGAVCDELVHLLQHEIGWRLLP